MSPARLVAAPAFVLAALASACAPAPGKDTSTPAAATGAAPAANAPTAQASPSAAKKATMVCRDSQTGAKAKCGAPGAVLVEVKTE